MPAAAYLARGENQRGNVVHCRARHFACRCQASRIPTLSRPGHLATLTSRAAHISPMAV
ncbi:hypothetical protein [Sinosporangium siamense]|uniref:Uncharacterized protein n=1 Tax=Sinosporangium siamense TaxID=1367973 RepID=A0A919RD05_9ACTN|nr:hypothetical protein [Sinosporangium siamense]GII91388.1 hypothetical protein Ssi02_16190 [Sinosporangium siamense]